MSGDAAKPAPGKKEANKVEDEKADLVDLYL